MDEPEQTYGIVLAAGAGTRYGGPKALARTPDGRPWLHAAVEALRGGGCDEVIVVLGAGADAAVSLVPAGARAVVATDWAAGLSHSLRAGLGAAAGADAAIFVPVDTPEIPASAVSRVRAAASALTTALVQAEYHGRPGHPVLVGAAHFERLARESTGDVGAGPFLSRHGVTGVECADLWAGNDIDRP
ncbi:NTP transferase domain-containing protein [Microbacterium sp. P07]|uniref:nucleotidyltransferase family protein n=1 Tax=Microbacterium sp. P07 TaxID=3366952 RepID=UPI0037475B43